MKIVTVVHRKGRGYKVSSQKCHSKIYLHKEWPVSINDDDEMRTYLSELHLRFKMCQMLALAFNTCGKKKKNKLHF